MVPALAVEFRTLTRYERYKNIDQPAKQRIQRRTTLKKKKSQLFQTRGAGLDHSFLMLPVHNSKQFHTKDKRRISLWMEMSMIFLQIIKEQ